MTDEEKAKIDAMDYTALLRLWRNAPIGHPMFEGETGEYYADVMTKMRAEVGPAEHTRVSKVVGWV